MRRIRGAFCLLSAGLIFLSLTACNSAEVNGARLTGSTFSLYGGQKDSFDTYSNDFLSGNGKNIGTGYFQHIGNTDGNSLEDKKNKLIETYLESGVNKDYYPGESLYNEYIQLVVQQEAFMDLCDELEAFSNLVNEKYTDPTVFTVINNDQTLEGEIASTIDVLGNVQQFVDDYNTLIKLINDVCTDNSIPGYAVLSRQQKEAMSEEEFDGWLSYAKRGVLNSNSIVKKILRSLQQLPDESYGDYTYSRLSDIGIERTDDRGCWSINTMTLQRALASDSNAAYNLLNQSIIPDLLKMADDTMNEINEYAGRSDDSYLGWRIAVFKEGLKIQD